MALVEMLALAAVALAVIAVSAGLGDLLGVAPWVPALVIVLGSAPLLRRSWLLLALPVAAAVFPVLALGCPWGDAPAVAVLTFLVLRWIVTRAQEWRDPALKYTHRGERLLEGKQYERAIAEYTKALATGPECAGYVHLERGLAFTAAQSYEEAIADFEQTLLQTPDNAAAYLYRGRAYLRRGDLKHALTDLDRAVQLFEGSGEAYLERGLVYEAQGRHREAMTEIEKAAASERVPTVVHYHKGRLHEHLDEPDRALASYRRFLRIGKWLDTIPWDDPAIRDAGARVRALKMR